MDFHIAMLGAVTRVMPSHILAEPETIMGSRSQERVSRLMLGRTLNPSALKPAA